MVKSARKSKNIHKAYMDSNLTYMMDEHEHTSDEDEDPFAEANPSNGKSTGKLDKNSSMVAKPVDIMKDGQ